MYNLNYVLMKSKLLIALLLFFGVTGSLFAQRVVTGTVTDKSDGSPIPGVNVVVESTTHGTTTDSDGHYSITVDNKAKTLVFSFIGYEKNVVEIGNRSRIDVQLKPSSLA